ncbi:MAG: hypothetical protein FWG89_09615 [Treponema sp.]|nr:hypothetical protein [Treponema sp.]
MGSYAAWLGMLAVFSGLSMNLVLHFGFAIKELALAGRFGKTDEHASPDRINQDPSAAVPASDSQKYFFAGLGIVFITILFLWLVILLARLILPLGLLEYVFLFPACFLVCSILEYLAIRFNIIVSAGQGDSLNMGSPFTGGLFSGAALFILLNIAGSLIEAVVLSVGFTLGIALAVTVVNEIRRRSEMEAVPRFLRGSPLALIAMGLLSLVFSSAAYMLFETMRPG